ncbi:MAG: hypothetical protein QXI58_07365 [Candidatus Micrarchaeia archaeon]
MNGNSSPKVIIPHFKVILYKWKDPNLCFDIYDEVDFAGNSLKDPLLTAKPVPEEEIPTETEPGTFVKYINEVYLKLADLARKSRPSLKVITGPGEINPNFPQVREYIKDFLEDKYSGYVGDDIVNINWKALPITTNYKDLSEPYQKYCSRKISYFNEKISGKSLSALVGEYVGEYDVTEATISIDHYTVTLDGVSLGLNFTFNVDTLKKIDPSLSYIMEGSVIDFYVDFSGDVYQNQDLRIGEYIGPATKEDLDEYLKSLSPKLLRTRRFIGVITSVTYNVSPGEIPSCTVRCEGLSGFLTRFNVVKDRALLTFFEQYSFDLQQPGPTVFQDNLNNKNFDEVFEYVLNALYVENVFDTKNEDELLGPTTDFLVNDSRLYEVKGLTFNPSKERNDNKVGKQGITFYKHKTVPVEEAKEKLSKITSIYLATFLYFKVREKYKPDILNAFNAAKEQLDKPTEKPEEKDIRIERYAKLREVANKVRACDIVAYCEGDEYTIRAYSLQIREAMRVFYNLFAKGSDILNELAYIIYMNIFEDEPGTLVCRIPRINNVFDNDLFIIRKEDIINMSWSRNDFELLTRQDYSALYPLSSEEFPWPWNFTDPQILVKYGPSIAERNTHPLMTLFHLNYLAKFCAVILSLKNAKTRTLKLTLANRGQRFCLGRTYFIEDPLSDISGIGWVGTLKEITYNFSELTIDLNFIFVRRTKLDSLSALPISSPAIQTV